MKKRRRWAVTCICIVSISVLLWLEISAFWVNLIGELEDGIVLRLSEDTKEQEANYAKDRGWQVIRLKSNAEDGYWFWIKKESVEEIYYYDAENLTEQIFGNEIEGETLNLTLHKRLLKQFDIIFLIIAIFPVSIWIVISIWKKMCEVHQGLWQKGVECVWLCLIFFMFLSLLLGAIRIPREFLPEKNIFEFQFYVEKVVNFLNMMERDWGKQKLYLNLKHVYEVGIKSYGIFSSGAWLSTIWLAYSWRKDVA